MNKIVRSHYPASKLPADLREGIDPQSEVSVTVEEVEGVRKPLSIDELWALREPPFRTKDEIDAFIREQRDE